MSFDIFRNHQRKGKEELDSYIPSWYQQIHEMCANNKFAGYTMDRIADDLEQLLVNQFIQMCDIKMLVKFEIFLKIKYTSENIDMRRKKALAYWNGNRTMNRTRIKELIQIYMGCDSRIWFDHVLHIMVESDTAYPKEFIETMWDQMPSYVKWIPAYEMKFDYSILEKIILKNIIVRTETNQKAEEKNNTYLRINAAQYLKEQIGKLEVITQTPDCKFYNGKVTFKSKTKYNNKCRKEVEE